jgi:S-adenosyl-L-methionine hydrolase (adenosine-forming)
VSITSRRPVITLLTDYGVTDEFVGVLHGVIAGICPDASVIDLSHGVAPQDIRAGAAVLLHSLQYMPVGVHVAVVDPTVGSDRRAVALRLADGRILVGPDNGLLWPASVAAGGVEQAVEISASPWRLEPVSATFHGRDIFAAVGAHLAAGEPLDLAGQAFDPGRLVQLETPRASAESGTVLAPVIGVDGFGNVQLGAVHADLESIDAGLGDRVELTLESGEAHVGTYALTFSDVSDGELLLFEDSTMQLALAVNRGRAADRLGVRGGDQLRISARREP